MTAPDGRPVTEVAVGVLIRADRAVLLADRPSGKPYAGYWEFPGGKVEADETVSAALARELREELGLEIGAALPWVTIEFDYPHAYVRLHFERVFDWAGTPHGREGQRVRFHRIGAPPPAPLLPAAVPALKWLGLPEILTPIRDGWLADPAARERPLRVLTVSELRSAPARPDVPWAGAVTEDRTDVERAAAIACDFVLVGPVLEDQQGLPPLGWQGLARSASSTPLPVVAFGGLAAADLDRARSLGAHGIVVSATR